MLVCGNAESILQNTLETQNLRDESEEGFVSIADLFPQTRNREAKQGATTCCICHDQARWFSCEFGEIGGQGEKARTRLRNKSKWARPNICLFMNLRRLTWPV